MKKILSLVLVAAIALMVCSCGVAKVPTVEEVKGSTSGNVYTNEYLSLKFTKPAEWEFYTEEQIEELSGNTQDMLAEGGYEMDDTSRQYYDMMAIDNSTGNNINIVYQIVGTTGKIDYNEVLDTNKEEIRQLGEALGLNYTFSDYETVKLSGVEFHKFVATADFEGISLTQAAYVAVERGVCISMAITIIDDLDVRAVEAMFS